MFTCKVVNVLQCDTMGYPILGCLPTHILWPLLSKEHILLLLLLHLGSIHKLQERGMSDLRGGGGGAENFLHRKGGT